ncbi:MAG: carboxypeptidase regulatory-like domain-containing protein [Longimicrobiaceae bacterium]
MGRFPTRGAFPLLLAAPFLFFSAPLLAQAGGAVLELYVSSAETGQPLSGAQITVEGTGAGGVTASDGWLRLSRLLPGPRTVRVRFLGYASDSANVNLSVSRVSRVGFQLRVEPIPLQTLEVRASATASGKMADFFRRRERGFGYFLTHDQIRDIDPMQVSDLLRRVPGVRLRCGVGGCRPEMGRLGGRYCPIQYYLDGIPAYGLRVDNLSARDLEGVEVYAGASVVPPEFNRGTANCGVIVIWTIDPALERERNRRNRGG